MSDGLNSLYLVFVSQKTDVAVTVKIVYMMSHRLVQKLIKFHWRIQKGRRRSFASATDLVSTYEIPKLPLTTHVTFQRQEVCYQRKLKKY